MTDSRIRSQVSRADLIQTANLVWNSFVDLLSSTTYEQLDSVQQVAHLAFWYDTEVKNGGHQQYFLHQGTDRLKETLQALDELGAKAQGHILTRASRLHTGEPAPDTGESMDDLDLAFHACRPELPELLEQYLNHHIDAFIEYQD